MLNKERREVINAMSDRLSGLNVDFEKVGFKGRLFTSEFEEWVHSEYVEPFKITLAEEQILEDMNNYAKYDNLIVRCDDFGGIALSSESGVYETPFYNHRFDWIKEGETYKISDILENCEVVG